MNKFYICDFCGSGSTCRRNLRIHLAHAHSTEEFACHSHSCGKKFKTQDALRNHVLIHGPPTVQCRIYYLIDGNFTQCSHMERQLQGRNKHEKKEKATLIKEGRVDAKIKIRGKLVPLF